MNEKETGIIKLMSDLEEMESFLSQCPAIEFTQRKRWARVCREAINKFTLILSFIRGFLPNFMRERNLLTPFSN
jgi:hypothetical protein